MKAIKYIEKYISTYPTAQLPPQILREIATIYYTPRLEIYDQRDKAYYWGQSAAYWEKFVGISSSQDDLRHAALAFQRTAFWSQEGDLDALNKALGFCDMIYKNWSKIKYKPKPMEAHEIIHIYNSGAFYETDLRLKKRYQDQSDQLCTLSGIGAVYQMGDSLVVFSAAEMKEMRSKESLRITLPEEDPQETPALVKKKKKKKKKKPSHAQQIAKIEDIQATFEGEKETPDEESDVDEPEPVMAPVKKETQETNIVTPEPQIHKLTKTEKKLLRQKDEEKAPEFPVQKAIREHSVDALTVAQIRKAYDTKEFQEEAMGVLDASLSLESGANERIIVSYISRLKKYFSVRKNDDFPKTVILGHDVPDFYFHSAHGKRQGDWDAGMIRRFKSFVRDIKVTFEAIIQ